MAAKVLGQLAPASGVYTTALYTTPAGKEAISSSLTATNRASTADTIRIRIAVSNATTDDKQWIAYDVPVLAKSIVPFTLGITLGAGDVVYAGSSAGSITFQLFGEER